MKRNTSGLCRIISASSATREYLLHQLNEIHVFGGSDLITAFKESIEVDPSLSLLLDLCENKIDVSSGERTRSSTPSNQASVSSKLGELSTVHLIRTALPSTKATER
jgi:hypothetical protein